MLRKTFSCSELCTRWDINKNDLTGIVRDGKLRALNDEYSLVEIKDDAYFYQVNGNPGAGAVSVGAPLSITDENGFYFNIIDVEAFERENGITLRPSITDPLQKDNLKSTIPVYENAFVHQGDAWVIWFKGNKLMPIKNMNGLTYIANLLLKPGKYINVIDLCDAIQVSKDKSMISNEDLADSLNEEDMSISNMKDDVLNKQGSGKLKKELQMLRKEITEYQEIIDDPESLESEKKEAIIGKGRIIKILDEFNKNSVRKVNRTVKRDMDRAGKGINRAIDKIHKQSPELADYLEKTIKTGTQYNFTDISTPWYVSI